MSLADFTPATHEIKASGATFKVRGLTLDDLSLLVSLYLPNLQQAVDLYNKGKAEGLSIEDTLMVILQTMPVFGAQVVAMGAGEPELIESAKALPGPVQIEAIGHIMRLTFEDVGGPKTFAASMAKMLQGAGLKLPALIPLAATATTAGAARTRPTTRPR